MIVSPFRRALDTARIVFKDHKDKPKMIVWPFVKEVLSSSTDIPIELEEVKKQYPEFDFSPVEEQLKNPELWMIETLYDKELRERLLKQALEIKKNAKGDENVNVLIRRMIIEEQKKVFPE